MNRLFYLLVLCLLTGCSLPLIETEMEGGESAETGRSVRILTRSTSGISYPLTIYAFDTEKGTLVNADTQQSDTEELLLILPAGDYYMVAIAGTEGCEMPSSPTLESVIGAPSNGLLNTPLQMGSAAVKVMQNTTVSLMLYNRVAAIDLALYDIPTDVTSVSTSLSLMASGITLGGNYVGNATTTIPLTKEDDVWFAPQFYTLPSMGENLTLSITTTSQSGTQTYGYTHPSPLKANTPYTLSGSLVDGLIVNGDISLAGWNETEAITFNFGNEGNNNNEHNQPNKEEIYRVSTLPEVGSLWEGHLVASILESEEDGITSMLLLSTSEWTGVTSALHEETPRMAADIASAYTEEGIAGWSIPTRQEAGKMCIALGNTSVEETNAFLAENGIAPLGIGTDTDSKNAIRYLCDNAQYSFKWDSEGSPSKAGSKRGYHLRLVKTVRFSVIEE